MSNSKQSGRDRRVSRRRLLNASGSSLVALSAGSVGSVAATNKTEVGSGELYKELERKYGSKEARIILSDLKNGEEMESSLSDSRLTNIRQDYLRFQYSRSEERRNIEPSIKSAASVEEIRQSKREAASQTADNWTNPCYNCSSINNCSKEFDQEVVWFSQQVNESDWGAANASLNNYCADLGQYNEKPFGIGGKTWVTGIGGADIDLRLKTPLEDMVQPGDEEVVADIKIRGTSLNASGELNFIRVTQDGYIDREKIRSVGDIDRTLSVAQSYNFQQNDSIGIELILSSSAYVIDGGSWMDYRKNNTRGVWVTDIEVR